MPWAVVDSFGVIAIANLQNHGLRIFGQDKVKRHTLRTYFTSHLESDLDALRLDSLSVINDVATARGPEITWTDVSGEGKSPIADNSNPRVEIVVGDKILEIDVTFLGSHPMINPSNLCQCLGHPFQRP